MVVGDIGTEKNHPSLVLRNDRETQYFLEETS